MAKKYDEFGLEIEDSSKKTIVFFIIVTCIIIFLLIFLVLKIAAPKHDGLREETPNTNKIEEQPAMDSRSEFNEEANLVIPSFANGTIYEEYDLKIIMSNLQADKSGYTFTIVGSELGEDNYILNCNKISIDSFETSANFTLYVNAYSSDEVVVRIPIEELNILEINDFNKLTFFFDIQESGSTKSFIRDVVMSQNIPIINTKKGLLKIDEKNDLLINYYKKIEDDTNTYLYFEIENNKESNQVIKIKKLLLNDNLYEVNDFSQNSHALTKNIFYLKIPKKEINNIEKLRISFFIFDTIIDGKATYITNEKELTLK